ncbi:MAG: uroporphyrinogen-III C-methyltransferase [Pseudomonadota bacterium]|nr:uroporphyrinogen-III C-methyltransferase [Pseudomonadota bacterium]
MPSNMVATQNHTIRFMTTDSTKRGPETPKTPFSSSPFFVWISFLLLLLVLAISLVSNWFSSVRLDRMNASVVHLEKQLLSVQLAGESQTKLAQQKLQTTYDQLLLQINQQAAQAQLFENRLNAIQTSTLREVYQDSYHHLIQKITTQLQFSLYSLWFTHDIPQAIKWLQHTELILSSKQNPLFIQIHARIQSLTRDLKQLPNHNRSHVLTQIDDLAKSLNQQLNTQPESNTQADETTTNAPSVPEISIWKPSTWLAYLSYLGLQIQWYLQSLVVISHGPSYFYELTPQHIAQIKISTQTCIEQLKWAVLFQDQAIYQQGLNQLTRTVKHYLPDTPQKNSLNKAIESLGQIMWWSDNLEPLLQRYQSLIHQLESESQRLHEPDSDSQKTPSTKQNNTPSSDNPKTEEPRSQPYKTPPGKLT